MTVLWKKLSPYLRKDALDAYSRSYTEIADAIRWILTGPVDRWFCSTVFGCGYHNAQVLLKRSWSVVPLITQCLRRGYRTLQSQHSIDSQTLKDSSPVLAGSSSRQLSSQLCHIYVRTLQQLMEGTVSSLYLVLLAEQLAEARELCSLLSTFLRRSHSLLDSATRLFLLKRPNVGARSNSV